MNEVEITIRIADRVPLSVKATLTGLDPDAGHFLEALDLAYQDACAEISRHFTIMRAKAAV